jgi:hypothetical protein
MITIELIRHLLKVTEGDIDASLCALEDGEYLGTLDVPQETVENAHHTLRVLIGIDGRITIDDGGRITMHLREVS